MKTLEQIRALLPELDQRIADEMEDQDLDFKSWDTQSRDKAVKTLVRMAICMANGGGGTVVFGVADKVLGRSTALEGVPPEIDVNRLKQAVYDQTDPKITPVFEELHVAEGTGRLIVMQVHPGMPPHTDTAGTGTIRVGKDCQPLTGTMRRKIGVETGETDFTAEPVGRFTPDVFSPTALEALRNMAAAEKAPQDLLRLNDRELLEALEVVRHGKLLRAAILLAGTEAAIQTHIPGHNWTFLKMKSDTAYDNRADDITALPLSVNRLETLLVPYNPLTTLEQGLFHFEYRVWPEIALREALMNAFCHPDYRVAGPVMLKLYKDRLELSNNGGFIGGIRPDNILHHQPVPRNPLLVDALTKLRLVNRSNLGISRMYTAMLMEGKEPPRIQEIGDSVTVTFPKSELSPAFRTFVAEESRNERELGLDALLVLRHLINHPEAETTTLAHLCQRPDAHMREILSKMEQAGYLEHGGSGRGAYWTLRPEIHHRLREDGHPERDRRIDWEAAKTRVLSVLMEREKRGEPGLGNRDIRQITRFDRQKVVKLMKELVRENPQVQPAGPGRYGRYQYQSPDSM
ncbi:MAG: putative DNA binding domain-containing protein [Verrucomicrobia bacterium]|nr:putative DNA binding domain-containing protein [Verrucomicrobiota bacterium]MCH8511654.1 putative DNA binding domain-containing protein [Kiritimatiellia bacterium]